MKNIILILTFLLVLFSAKAQSSNENIEIRVSGSVALSKALEEIERQTNYSFIYDARSIDLSTILTHPIEGYNLVEVLKSLFLEKDIVFTFINNQIILSPKASVLEMQKQSKIQMQGVVLDLNNEPLAGVNIWEKGTTNGTISAMDGSFSLVLPEKALLGASYIGFRSKEISYTGQRMIQIQMTEDLHQLEEVVITALGIEKKESSLPYSNQIVSGDELVRVKEVNMINSLSGKMAGVQINRASSGLGGSARVIIRGSRSASGNNQPLYVIDGVPILNTTSEQALTTIGGTADAGNRDSGDGISNLNPDDIESLNVLKGSYASALYGGQAANGVILIKTKKGSEGRKNINFSSTLIFDQAISLPEFQNNYSRVPDAATSWGDRSMLPIFDHVKDFFQTGVTSMNTLTFSSGNKSVQNYFSYANTTGRGIVQNHKLNKHNFNVRETASFFDDRLNLDGNVNLILQTVEGKPTVGGFYMNPLQGLYSFPRGMDIRPYKEQFEVYSEKRNMQVQNWYTTITDFEQNPYWLINRVKSLDKRGRVLANVSANYKISDWLTLQARGNVDYINDKFQQKIYASTSPGIAGENGRYIHSTYQATLLYGDVMAKFRKNWNYFSLNAAFGGSLTDTRVNQLRLDSKTASLYYPNVFTISNINMSSSAYIDESDDARRQIQSVFAMAQLGYRDFLYLDVTARNDWSSTLAFTSREDKGFFYPSVGLSWIASHQFQLPDIISYAKLRGSWSKVGNDIPMFVSNTVGHISAGGIPKPNDTAPFGSLKPEMSTSIELGTELRFFSNRFDLDITFYKTNTRNQLFTLPSSAGAAYKYYYVNAGNIQNMGLEISSGAYIFSSTDFRWRTNLNFSRNRNLVKKLHDDLASFTQGEGGFSSSYTMRLVEGGSFGDIYGKAFERNEAGKIKLGIDGLPLQTGNGNTIKVGNCNPDFLLGWGNTFNYRNFSFYMLIDGSFGGEVLSQTQAVLDQVGVSKITGKSRDNGFVNLEGQPIYNVQGFYEQVGGRSGVTEYYMYDATHVRLREISLGYTLATERLRKNCFLKEASFSLVARNLCYFYKKAPFDPESVLSAENSNQGIDIFGIPTTRSIGFNVKLSF